MKISNTVVSKYKNYIIKKYKSEEDLNNHDIFKFNNTFYFRGYYKSYKQIDNVKQLNNFKIQDDLFKNESPLSRYSYLTNVQKTIINDFDKIMYYGTVLYKAPCGAGKTKAALELIHHFKLRTLIISCRNAVNDQWKKELNVEFEKLKIITSSDFKKSDTPFDVLILTPQFIIKHNTEYFKNLNVDLIIYDEIHSLTSDQFSKVLNLPFELSMKYNIYLPILLGLTASLPVEKSHSELLKQIFGIPKKITGEKITNIPVYYSDYRDTIPNRGTFDQNYIKPDEHEVINILLNKCIDYNISPTVDFKMIIISSTIESSIYSAVKSAVCFQKDVLIVRSAKEYDYIIHFKYIPDWYYTNEEDQTLEYSINALLKDNEEQKDKFIEKCKYSSKLSDVSVICGTIDRLKEGFNCENIVYGICSLFEWSITTRIQLLGRIRRNSKNEELNKHKRLFLVCSGKIKNDLVYVKMNKIPKKPEITYNIELEDKLFKEENYIKIGMDEIKE